MATGEFAYAPSFGVLPNETQETQQFNTVDLVEENINAESNFNDDLDEMMNAGFRSGGWEGTAHDGHLFQYAINKKNLNFSKPPPGKYYVVNAGYQQMEGYLVPYKGARYHLPDFQCGGRPRGLKEIFNHWHLPLRCCIERTFGVWKARWKILRTMPPYSFHVQRDIVIVSIALHNYIRRKALADPAFERLD
ncbi:hypothetical protein GH714_013111 [Hevea brasiliensis]|uniref:DDE Tnp4 domain-containing protein n=1 Tax=Hevea brasiliensis TaxID=3981 RepID=A0A6A6M9X1_HEVBR|nr:hypothetical protein GH714_013111 [Hevea brasiliensis]